MKKKTKATDSCSCRIYGYTLDFEGAMKAHLVKPQYYDIKITAADVKVGDNVTLLLYQRSPDGVERPVVHRVTNVSEDGGYIDVVLLEQNIPGLATGDKYRVYLPHGKIRLWDTHTCTWINSRKAHVKPTHRNSHMKYV